MRKRSLMSRPRFKSGHRSRFTGICFAAVAVILLGTQPADAQSPNTHDVKNYYKYQRCIALAKTDPDAAFDMALAWQDLGGGEAAGHCVAAALIGLKIYTEAAVRLETLVQDSKAEPAVRAGMLSQAAQAWLLDGKLERAESVLDAALELTKDDAGLLTDRAVVRAGMKRFSDAVTDLTAAIKIDPTLAEAYVYRASAYRQLKKLTAARADIEQALRLDKNNAAGFLERGILRRLAGDQDGARADWLAIIRLAPDSAAARSAQANLEKMDVKKR